MSYRNKTKNGKKEKTKLPLGITQSETSTSGSRGQEEEQKVSEAVQIKGLLHQNTEEMRSIIRALNGEYIEPQAGGDLLRDGAGVLPTGHPFLFLPRILSFLPFLIGKAITRQVRS